VLTRSAYGYVNNNPINAADPSGLIGPLAIGLGYLAVEAGLSLWDAYDAYTTINDGCASGAAKWFAGGAFLAGVFMPGNIGWADDAVDAGRGLWRITKEGTERTLQHGKWGSFAKSSSDGLWWSRDRAGHGRSVWKVYTETSTGLRWRADADEFGDFIVGKHKSSTGEFIPWKDLSG
jgi:hypothetical protein